MRQVKKETKMEINGIFNPTWNHNSFPRCKEKLGVLKVYSSKNV